MANLGFEINEESLATILAEVEQDLVPVIKSAKDDLKKAQDASAPPTEESSESSEPSAEGSSPASPAPASAPGAEASSPAPAGDDSAPPFPPGDASAPPSPEAAPASPEGSAFPSDPAALQAMVAAQPPEVQKALYLAAKSAIFAAQASAAPSPAPAPASPSPAAPPPGPDAGVPAMKGEMKSSPGNGGDPVSKSETSREVEELKKLVKTQNDQIALITQAVTHLASTPIRKAITGIGQLKHIAKSEGKDVEVRLTKSEVTAKLREKSRDDSLSKKDRANITKFYDTGSENYSLIKHLLE